jgi:hypothetical protein
VRIPLADFGVSGPTKVHGVRFTFDRTASDDIHLADVRFSRPIAATPAGAVDGDIVPAPRPVVRTVRAAPLLPVVDKGRVAAIRATTRRGMAEIELEARDQIPVRDALPVLRIGDKAFRVSRFPNRGATYSIAFALTAAELAALPQGAPVVVESGAERWGFGTLEKR